MNVQQLIERYHESWTTGELEAARQCLADQLDFEGSIDTFDNAEDFVVALGQFQKMLKSVMLLRAFYGDGGAALLYDCDTSTPAGVIRTAEFFRVRDGKIHEIRLVFDATTLRQLMGA